MPDDETPRDRMVRAVNTIDIDHLTFDQARALRTMLRVAIEGLGDEISDENHNRGELGFVALENLANMLEAAGFSDHISMK